MFQRKEEKIVIGSENFTEALILGNIYSQLIQDQTDIKVEEKFNLNGTMITMSAMERGDIDTFTDYTGVLISNVLKEEMSSDPKEVYDRVKQAWKKTTACRYPILWDQVYLCVCSYSGDSSAVSSHKAFRTFWAQAGSLKLGCTTAFYPA